MTDQQLQATVPDEPPAGADQVYDVLSSRIVRQLSDADSLDNKLGAAVAVLIAIAGAIYAAQPPRILAGLISGWVLVALVQAVRGSTYDQRFTEGENMKFLLDRLALSTSALKWHAIEVLKKAYAVNHDRLDRKGQLLSQVVATAGAIAGLALLGKMLGLA